MNDFNRFIFTDNKPSKWEYLADYALAIILALSLTMGALAYFDVLVP